ncbi:MAG TPA: hypothetical protein VFS40_07935 [Gemmatimonadales bacterium]|nr:hypothetical protein [Gemmatimonadales bacterium]
MSHLRSFGRRTACALATPALVALALAAGARPAAAQKLSLSPTIGIYVPTADLYKVATGTTEETFRPELSLTLGGRLGLWVSPRLGIEATGDYAPGKLKFTTEGQSKVDANTFTGAGRVTYFVIPNSSPVYLSVTGGVGYVKRSGEFYKGTNPATGQPYTSDELSDITGTAGARLGFRLGRLLHLSVGAEDYIYKPDVVKGAGANVTTKTQHDVHLNFGVGIPLLGLGS